MSDVEIVRSDLAHSMACACPACTGVSTNGTEKASLDTSAGGVFRDKPIWTPDQIAANLNRTGLSWNQDSPANARQQGDTDPSTITFGFFNSQSEMIGQGYTYYVPGNPTLYGIGEIFNFTPFTAAQRSAAREGMQHWDDALAVKFVETHSSNADINFGNLTSAPTTQAYANLPAAVLYSPAWANDQLKEQAGDVWISASQASNFRLDEGSYGFKTLMHEVGHAIGLSHPGAYNAAPGVSITYGPNAEYAQDTRAYTIMSYFDGFEQPGVQHNNFNTHTLAYSATPLIHDIYAAQKMYGADMTTRTGDTTYGFNSNAGREAFDFNLTPAPIIAIWDAGGNDTIDASGYATKQLIDLTPGSLSSIGGVTADTAPSFEQVNANRAAANYPAMSRAAYDANIAAIVANPEFGRMTDNVGIAYGVTIENAIGGSGADTIIGNAANNGLFGNAGADFLSGKEGNDTLDGGAGADTLSGGDGDDIYVVDQAGDVLIEEENKGKDTVRSAISFTLAAAFENLILTGSAVAGTGNAAANEITGNAMANQLFGEAGDDRLFGGEGDDTLDGGAGADTMAGGAGDDRYLVNDLGDLVTEADGQGMDRVESSISYTLTAHVENLTLTGAAVTGTGNALNNVITGNAANNRLFGGEGDDQLFGGAGDDLLDGGAGADTLVGGAGADTLLGGSGNDRLEGGEGVDQLTGGAGDDVFVASATGPLVQTKMGAMTIDVIWDFDLNGNDMIDLRGIDANPTVAGTQGFRLVNGFGGDMGELSVRSFGNVQAAEMVLGIEIDGLEDSTGSGPVTVLFGNTDSDSDPEFALILMGTSSSMVGADDFTGLI
jgi:serralysin